MPATDRSTAPPLPPIEAYATDATVLICTYNRARYLGPTLDSLARQATPPGLGWDVIVVDNNSTDDTREVVESRAGAYPVRLRYLFEPVQGKSNALNTGMRAAAARIIVFTDDDVELPPEWLRQGVVPLMEREDIDYTGGPVRAIWEAPPPAWLDASGNLGGTIAVKDHGAEPFIFEERRKTPLGVNMAVRRTLVERIGGFRPDLGRNGNSLLGQEQADFFYRSRQVGARGLYVPAMVLDHHVPAARLTFDYFRRWWYWKGISQARLHHIHGMTELGLDLRGVPRVGGAPRYLWRIVAEQAGATVRHTLAGRMPAAVESFLLLCYAAGYIAESRRMMLRSAAPASAPPVAVSAPRS